MFLNLFCDFVVLRRVGSAVVDVHAYSSVFSSDCAIFLWPLRCHLLLKAAYPAHFIHKGQVSAEIPYKELCSLTADASCMAAWKYENKLDEAARVRHNWCDPLPSARETVVSTICRNLGVGRLHAFKVVASTLKQKVRQKRLPLGKKCVKNVYP